MPRTDMPEATEDISHTLNRKEQKKEGGEGGKDKKKKDEQRGKGETNGKGEEEKRELHLSQNEPLF